MRTPFRHRAPIALTPPRPCAHVHTFCCAHVARTLGTCRARHRPVRFFSLGVPRSEGFFLFSRLRLHDPFGVKKRPCLRQLHISAVIFLKMGGIRSALVPNLVRQAMGLTARNLALLKGSAALGCCSQQGGTR